MTSLTERLDADLRGQLRRGRPLIDELDRHAIDPTLPVDARVAMSAAARELERLTEPKRASLLRAVNEVERYELLERARILVAAAGPQAAEAPPWGWSTKKRRTHCENGHAFTPENTVMAQNYRRCRACGRQRTRRWRERMAQWAGKREVA